MPPTLLSRRVSGYDEGTRVEHLGRADRPALIGGRYATQWVKRGNRWLIRDEVEQQAGTEVGADLLWERDVQLHVTRFDQRASGLVRPVASKVAPSFCTA